MKGITKMQAYETNIHLTLDKMEKIQHWLCMNGCYVSMKWTDVASAGLCSAIGSQINTFIKILVNLSETEKNINTTLYS